MNGVEVMRAALLEAGRPDLADLVVAAPGERAFPITKYTDAQRGAFTVKDSLLVQRARYIALTALGETLDVDNCACPECYWAVVVEGAREKTHDCPPPPWGGR